MTETERVTLRIPVQDLQALDLFVGAGQYSNRSEVIRQSIKDFVRLKAKEVKEGMEARRDLQDTFLQLQQMQDQIKQQQEALERLMRK